MRKWTLEKAIKVVGSCKDVTIDGALILAKEGLTGLTACSALSYLTKVHKYLYISKKHGRYCKV